MKDRKVLNFVFTHKKSLKALFLGRGYAGQFAECQCHYFFIQKYLTPNPCFPVHVQ